MLYALGFSLLLLIDVVGGVLGFLCDSFWGFFFFGASRKLCSVPNWSLRYIQLTLTYWTFALRTRLVT